MVTRKAPASQETAPRRGETLYATLHIEGPDQTSQMSEKSALDLYAIEFSSRALRISTNTKLTPETKFRFAIGNTVIPMRFAEKSLDVADSNRGGYWIEAADASTTIDDLIASASNRRDRDVPPTIIVNDCVLRSARYRTATPMTAQVKTFGTNSPFGLSIVNLSRSGMLLETATGSSLPYQLNTILEIELESQGSERQSRIQCLGKVVRCVENYSAKGTRQIVGVAIAIVDIEERQRSLWDASLTHIEDVLQQQVSRSEGGQLAS